MSARAYLQLHKFVLRNVYQVINCLVLTNFIQ